MIYRELKRIASQWFCSNRRFFIGFLTGHEMVIRESISNGESLRSKCVIYHTRKNVAIKKIIAKKETRE